MSSVLYYTDLYFGIEVFFLPAAQVVPTLISVTSPFLDLLVLSLEDSCLAKGHTLSQRQCTTEKGAKISGRSLWVLKLTYFIWGILT